MKWNADLFRTIVSNERSYFTAVVHTENGSHEFTSGTNTGYDYAQLSRAIFKYYGVLIPRRTDMSFERMAKGEQIAGVDNSHERSDCRVSLRERILTGWQACNLY